MDYAPTRNEKKSIGVCGPFDENYRYVASPIKCLGAGINFTMQFLLNLFFFYTYGIFLAHHIAKKILREIFLIWCNNVNFLRSIERKMCDSLGHTKVKRCFCAWKEHILLEKVETVKKVHIAGLLQDRNLTKRMLHRWRKVTKVLKMEKRIELEVAAKWVEVRKWLRDAQLLR
jgi:hypothetical protein